MSEKIKSIKAICSICGKFLHGDPESDNISHGYCERCGQAIMNEIDGKDSQLIFFDPRNKSNHIITRLSKISSDLIEHNNFFGRTQKFVMI